MNNYIIKTLNRFKKFIVDSTKCGHLDEAFRTIPTNMTRQRKLSAFTTIGLLLLNMKKSIGIDIDVFWSNFFPADALPPSGAAFCKARQKIKPAFFESCLDVSAKSFYMENPEIKTWKGYTVNAVDGSTLRLPNTKGIRKDYPPHTNNKGDHGPIGLVSVVYDVQNQIVRAASLSPQLKDNGEVSAGWKNIGGMESGKELFLLDRVYAGYGTLALMEHKGFRFVCRARVNVTKEAQAFCESDETEKTLIFKRNHHVPKRAQKLGLALGMPEEIAVRAVKIELPGGETELLLTNLTPEEATAEELSSLYSLRWGVEVAYGIVKNEEQICIFTGNRTCCVLQDFYCALILYNLDSLASKLNADAIDRKNAERQKKGKRPLSINRNFTWHLLLNHLFVWLQADADREADILMAIAPKFMCDLIVSNKGRSRPRCFKARNLNGKYFTFTNYRQAM